MEDIVLVRCVTCSHLGLSWKTAMNTYYMAASEIEAIGQLKNQLVEHANQHNELVQKLADKLVYLTEKYGLDKIKKAPPPGISGTKGLDSIPHAFSDEEFLKLWENEAVNKHFIYKVAMSKPLGLAPGDLSMQKEEIAAFNDTLHKSMLKDDVKDDVKSGRRISLEDEEE
jgi:hypothetical protein